jgi:hypothetical protein
MKKTIIYLMLVFTAVAFTTAAKWAEKPVENLDTIVGKWKGSGITGSGSSFEVEYFFRKDGSFDDRVWGPTWSKKFQRPPGTLRVNAGKLKYKGVKGPLRTGTLYEDKKGRRMLKFHGDDGMKLSVRAKK